MIKRAAKNTLGRLGIGVYRLPKGGVAPGGEVDVSALPEVDVVIDVGVAAGTPWLYETFAGAVLVLVDPVAEQPGVARLLGSRPYTFLQCALGSEPGSATMHVDVDDTARSSFLERTALTRTNNRYQEVQVEVRTLDQVTEDIAAEKSLGIKIDAEGFEMEVLRGASAALRRASFVICEASVRERFEGSYRLEELVCFMKSCGLGVESVMTAERDGNGVIRFVDLVFVPR